MARPRGRIQVGYRRPSHNQECRFFPPINYVLSYLRRRDSCSDAEVRANAIKSFILNGISLLSIYVFDLFLQPLTQEQPPQKWLHRSIGWFYRILWLLPLVGVSLYLNVRTRILHPCFLGQGTYLHRDCASAACLFCVCRPHGALSSQSALSPCGTALRFRTWGRLRPHHRTRTSRFSTRLPRLRIVPL